MRSSPPSKVSLSFQSPWGSTAVIFGGNGFPDTISLSIALCYGFNFAGWLTVSGCLPVAHEFILVQLGPCLDQFKLFSGNFPIEDFSGGNPDRCLIFGIPDMKMR